jgi:hypothetical protein
VITRWKLVRAALDATSKLLHAHALTDGDEGDDTLTSAEPNATFVQQLGVAARPVIARTLRALGVEHGAEVLLLKVWDKTKLPASLDEGETQVFACGDVTVRLRMRTTGVTLEAKGATVTITSVGAIQITPASGQDLTLNSGTLKVARETDTVSAVASMATWIGALTTYVNTAAPGTLVAPSGFGVIATGAGAARVKA